MEDVVGVEVNRGFAHLAVIVGIEGVGHIELAGHVHTIFQMVIEPAVGHDVGGEGAAATVQEIGLGVIAEAHRVVVIEDIVHARRGVNRVVVGPDVGMLIHSPCGVGLHVKNEIIILQVPVIVVPHAAEHVQPPVAVVPVEAERQVGSLAHVVSGLGVETEALALGPLGLDEDDRLDRRVILGTGIGNQFHALDVLAADLVQFGLILELAAVDIDERCAFAEDLQSVLLALHARQILEHSIGGAHLTQQCVFHVGLQALGRQLEGRALALDHDFA